MSSLLWEQVLQQLQSQTDPDEYRRWLAPTSYASDSGDLISVWVPTETDRRHLQTHYQDAIERAFRTLGRRETRVRFLVSGVGDEDEDAE